MELSSGKPWGESFTELLSKMSADLGGQIKWPDEGLVDEIFSYPTLTCKVSEREITLEIKRNISSSSYGWRGPGALHAIRGPIRVAKNKDNIKPKDSIEHLRVCAYVPDFHHLSRKYNIQVKHRPHYGRLDRLVRLIQLSPQTGNQDFDRRYSVDLVSSKDRELLSHREIRELIINAEPFSLLEISSSWIRWSQLLTDRKQLEFGTVKDRVLKVLELVNAICGLINTK